MHQIPMSSPIPSPASPSAPDNATRQFQCELSNYHLVLSRGTHEPGEARREKLLCSKLELIFLCFSSGGRFCVALKCGEYL